MSVSVCVWFGWCVWYVCCVKVYDVYVCVVYEYVWHV